MDKKRAVREKEATGSSLHKNKENLEISPTGYGYVSVEQNSGKNSRR